MPTGRLVQSTLALLEWQLLALRHLGVCAERHTEWRLEVPVVLPNRWQCVLLLTLECCLGGQTVPVGWRPEDCGTMFGFVNCPCSTVERCEECGRQRVRPTLNKRCQHAGRVDGLCQSD